MIQVYRRHLVETGSESDGANLDATIQLLEHTSALIEFFSTSRQSIRNTSDIRIPKLDKFLVYLQKWQEEVKESGQSRHFISDKLWFDLQSMIHGFKAIVNIKLAAFPNSIVKAWIINQDVVENHFCHVRACNGQNNNPSYRLQESTQNSIRYGQNTISCKSNVGIST